MNLSLLEVYGIIKKNLLILHTDDSLNIQSPQICLVLSINIISSLNKYWKRQNTLIVRTVNKVVSPAVANVTSGNIT